MSTQLSGNRTLSAGDLVISVADIFDRLEGRVDRTTLEQLLSDIISGRRNQVRPGELITAELMNQILAHLESLETRVKALEAGSTPSDPVVITGLEPSGAVPMQSDLRIIGRNFGSTGSNIVTIDGVRVTRIKEGSNTHLVVEVPLLAGVPEQGKTATLTLSNASGFAQTTVFVVPAVQTIPRGSLAATLSRTPTDPQLLAGQSYTFVFAVQAISNMEEVFTLAPNLSTGWPAMVVDGSDVQITPPEIRIPKSDPPSGTTRDVRVRITIPAGTPVETSALLRLAVTSKRNPGGFSNTSGGDRVTVGQAPPPPQRIAVVFGGVISPSSAPQARFDENKVVAIPVTGTSYRVDFSVVIEDPGTATYNLVMTAPTGQWTATLQGSPTIQTTGPRLDRLVGVTLTAQPGAAAANIRLRVERSGDPTFFGEFSQPIRLGT